MAITGRLGLLALLGALGVGLLAPSWSGIVLVQGLLFALAGLDLVLAGRIDKLGLSRSGAESVRLGESASVTLTVTNTGRRAVRGVLRDAWPPSAGAVNSRHPIAVPAGERRTVTTVLQPTRRGVFTHHPDRVVRLAHLAH